MPKAGGMKIFWGWRKNANSLKTSGANLAKKYVIETKKVKRSFQSNAKSPKKARRMKQKETEKSADSEEQQTSRRLDMTPTWNSSYQVFPAHTKTPMGQVKQVYQK